MLSSVCVLTLLRLCRPAQSAEDKVPVWYIMDEFGSQVQHSDQPSCGMAPFFYIQGQLAYTVLWPLRDLEEGGESTATKKTKTVTLFTKRVNIPTHIQIKD